MYTVFSLRNLVAGERCHVTGEHFKRGWSTSEKKIILGYWTSAEECCVVNGEFSDLRSMPNEHPVYMLQVKFTKIYNNLKSMITYKNCHFFSGGLY